MADRRHAVTQLDFFIRQVTLFADEIRNAVGQKLDVLGFKTTAGISVNKWPLVSCLSSCKKWL